MCWLGQGGRTKRGQAHQSSCVSWPFLPLQLLQPGRPWLRVCAEPHPRDELVSGPAVLRWVAWASSASGACSDSAPSTAGCLPACALLRPLIAADMRMACFRPCRSFLVPYAGQTPVPSGEFSPVAGTIYDFRQPMALGDHVNSPELGGWPANRRGWCCCGPAVGRLALRSALALLRRCCAISLPCIRLTPLSPSILLEWLGGYDNVWALVGLGADAVDVAKDFQVAAE